MLLLLICPSRSMFFFVTVQQELIVNCLGPKECYLQQLSGGNRAAQTWHIQIIKSPRMGKTSLFGLALPTTCTASCIPIYSTSYRVPTFSFHWCTATEIIPPSLFIPSSTLTWRADLKLEVSLKTSCTMDWQGLQLWFINSQDLSVNFVSGQAAERVVYSSWHS